MSPKHSKARLSTRLFAQVLEIWALQPQNRENLVSKEDEIKLLSFLKKSMLENELFGEASLVAIAGLQGVGKTTFTKRMFAAESKKADWQLETFLPENNGRGEVLPVLLKCDINLKKPLAEIYTASASGGYWELFSEASEFYSKLRNPTQSQVLARIKLPNSSAFELGQSFLLLPGLERETKHNTHWQELVSFSLQQADACIFVTSPSAHATEKNQEILNEVMVSFGHKSCIALSKADQERNCAEFKTTVCEKWNLTSSRVECFGTDDEFEQKFIETRNSLLLNLNSSRTLARTGRFSWANEDLLFDLKSVLAEIQTKLKLFPINSDASNSKTIIAAGLKTFDQEAQQLSEQISDNLSREFDRAYNLITHEEWGEVSTGFTTDIGYRIQEIFGYNPRIKLQENFFDTHVKQNINLPNAISRALSDAKNTQLSRLLGVIDGRQLYLNKPSISDPKSSSEETMQQISRIKNVAHKYFSAQTQVLSETTSNSLVVNEHDGKDLKLALEIMPAMLLNHFTESVVLVEKSANKQLETNLVKTEENSLMADIGKFAIGADILIDGKADIFVGSLTALGVPTTAATVAAGWAVAAIFTIVAANEIAKAVSAGNLREIEFAKYSIRRAHSQIIDKIIEAKEKDEKLCRDKIERNLLEKLGVTDADGKHTTFTIAVENALTTLRKIIEESRRNFGNVA